VIGLLVVASLSLWRSAITRLKSTHSNSSDNQATAAWHYMSSLSIPLLAGAGQPDARRTSCLSVWGSEYFNRKLLGIGRSIRGFFLSEVYRLVDGRKVTGYYFNFEFTAVSRQPE
jgi:hypothetical protein